MYFLYIFYYLHFGDEYLPELSKHLVYRDVEQSHTVWKVSEKCYSGPYFPAFGLNTERYSVFLRIQFENAENTNVGKSGPD